VTAGLAALDLRAEGLPIIAAQREPAGIRQSQRARPGVQLDNPVVPQLRDDEAKQRPNPASPSGGRSADLFVLEQHENSDAQIARSGLNAELTNGVLMPTESSSVKEKSITNQ
jgi:hypothetical protein